MRKYLQDVSVLNFYGHDIITGKDEAGEVWVPLKQIIGGHLGMNWKKFKIKLEKHVAVMGDLSLYNPTLILVDTRGYDIVPSSASCNHTKEGIGQLREQVCIKLGELNLLLAQINVVNIQDEERRAVVVVYQKECQGALHDYWMYGAAINSRETPSAIDSDHHESPLVMATKRLDKALIAYANNCGEDLCISDLMPYASECILEVSGITLDDKTLGYTQYLLAFLVSAVADIILLATRESVTPSELSELLPRNTERAWRTFGSNILKTELPFDKIPGSSKGAKWELA